MRMNGWALVALALGAACGSSSDETKKLNQVAYTVVEEGTLAHNGTSVQGTGKIAFDAALSEIAAKSGFALYFTLEDGGSLALIANASTKLENGVTVEFTRSGKSLKGALKAGTGSVDFTAKLASVDASLAISIFVDVHNNETPAHVVVWTGSDYSKSAAALNSEDSGFNTPGKGTETYWGLALTNAVVTTATVGGVKYTE